MVGVGASTLEVFNFLYSGEYGKAIFLGITDAILSIWLSREVYQEQKNFRETPPQDTSADQSPPPPDVQ